MLRGTRNVGQTTLPEATGGLSSASRSALAIRWLFPATGGPVTRLGDARVVLGRGEDCGTVLLGAEVSRYHAEIVRNGPIAILRDLGSTNGSYLNGARLAPEAPLGPVDVVRLGEWIGVVVSIAVSGVVSNGADASGDSAHGTVAPGVFGGPALRAVLQPALDVAQSDLPIIVEGETGTGKEVAARAIHTASRRQGSFLGVNCAALPENLAEAELFGYRRGAFTGADRASPGYFRAAHGGTLLLDEITDLPLGLQAKILRALEQREVIPLGESQPVAVDVRVIAAAQGSLERAVAEKRFRMDLYARLDGVTVRLPPLRERIEDVPYLFARLLHDMSGGHPPAVDPKLIEQLCLYDWPLNVRELVMLAKRLLVVHSGVGSLKLGHLPARLRRDGTGDGGSAGTVGFAGDRRRRGEPLPPAAAPMPIDQAERDEVDFERLIAALRVHGGNVSRAATAVGISRQRAYRLMQVRPELDLDGLRGSADADGNGHSNGDGQG